MQLLFDWDFRRWRPPFLAPWWRPPGWMVSVTDSREWRLDMDEEAIAASSVGNAERLSVPLHRILLETGIAATPATSAWDPRSWYPFFRYAPDFAGTAPRLRFYSGVAERDPRHTAIASEELAAGIATYILREHFGQVHIADVQPLIGSGDVQYVDPASGKRPDFFCLDGSNQALFAECKGKQGTRSPLLREIDGNARRQLENVRATRHQLRSSCNRVAIGTHFCVHGRHPQSETTTVVRDPEGPPSIKKGDPDDFAIRVAYAKVLRFLGLDSIAERMLLFRGFDPNDFPTVAIDGRDATYSFLGYSPAADFVFLESEILNRLASRDRFELVRLSGDRNTQQREERLHDNSDVGYFLNNGVAILFPQTAADIITRVT